MTGIISFEIMMNSYIIFYVFWGNSQNISGSMSDIQQTDIETEMDSNTDVPVKDDIENSKVTL